MSNLAIRTDGLSKKYRIGKRQEAYKTLRDLIASSFMELLKKIGGPLKSKKSGKSTSKEPIWALRDISFEIKQGEVVGIIGRNGAGKSTLLKILSRITEPTTGYAEIRGRVGSLLEVGTGFHAELTGRENIYLSGAILGMKKKEIDKKFDEIVSFAEVDRFIDTPVKHYSSGMYLRLAFAVAAHLEPEILFVDEVLAVGDARFQKKCIEKMKDIGHEGRTVLFVSHNMHAITKLCRRAILLEDGKLIKDDISTNVVSCYLGSDNGTSGAREWPDPERSPKGDVARLIAVRALTEEGIPSDIFDVKQPVKIEMEYEVSQSGHVLLPHFAFFNEEGIVLFVTIEGDENWKGKARPSGRYKSSAIIPGNFLSEGRLLVEADLITMEPVTCQFSVRDAVVIQIIDRGDGNSVRGNWIGQLPGVVRPTLKWETLYLS